MNERGLVVDFLRESDWWVDLLQDVNTNKQNDSQSKKVAKIILELQINSVLNDYLSKSFKQNLDSADNIVDIIEDSFGSKLDRGMFCKIDDLENEIRTEIKAILRNSFLHVDFKFAIWDVQMISRGNVLIEYRGDYRIADWHQRNGEEDDKGETVEYEISLTGLRTYIKSRLSDFAGNYAHKYLNKCVNTFVGVVIEEGLIKNGDCCDIIEPSFMEKALFNATKHHQDYPNLNIKLLDYFPAILPTQIRDVINDIDEVVKSELGPIYNAVTAGGKAASFKIDDTTLYLQVKKDGIKIDVIDKLSAEVAASLAAGDWVPERLRRVVNL